MNDLTSCVLAVDIGTTSTKTLAIDPEGRVLAGRSAEYPLHTPKPGYAEQDPEEIFAAVLRTVRGVVNDAELKPEQVLCVSFSSAMHSLIAIDEDGRPLTPSITFADQRSAEQAERLNADGTGLDVYLRTGTPVHPMSPLVKLIWMREREPELLAKAKKWLGIKEYVLYRLFGRCVVDYSIASATGLFNLRELNWDAGALKLAGIGADRLPEPVPTTYKLTGLKTDFAERMGLSPDTPFVTGASDGVLANLGIGAAAPGLFGVTIGTSSAVRAMVDAPSLDPKGRLFCYALTENRWIVGGASNNGGIVAQWAAERLYPGKPMEAVIPLTESVPPGANGLLMMPLLSGERAPFWDANARGMWFGLKLAHREQHMLKAGLEGVLFQVRAIQSLLEERAGKPTRLLASGGFARSASWCQMAADLLGTPVAVPEIIESSGLGAAQLGYYALEDAKGPLLRWESAKAQVFEPNPERAAVYNELFPIYLGLYDKLKDSMKDLSGFERRQAIRG